MEVRGSCGVMANMPQSKFKLQSLLGKVLDPYIPLAMG